MNYEDAAKFKKGRDAARVALNKAVNELCNKYELNRFEVLHAIVDKSVTEVENQAKNYPGMFPLTITNGLAETYHQHTLGLAERAYAQAAADPEPAGPPKKGGLKGLFAKAPKPNILDDPVLWSWTDIDEASKSVNATAAAVAKNYNLSGGKLTEYVPLTITKHQEDWENQPNIPEACVGGTIAKSTVEYYGYELPPGYDFVPTPWGSEYTITKLTAGALYALKNSEGEIVDVPMNKWLTKDFMQALGVWNLNLPKGVQWAGPGTYGKWALIYKGADWPAKDAVDLDEHLAEYTQKYPVYGHACGSKGCLDVTLNPGESKTFSGAYLASLGLKKGQIQNYLPSTMVVEYVANMDMIEVSYPV